MDMEALSVSRLNTNKDCNFKYFLQYHVKLPELRNPSIYTEKGVAVHEVLELYAKGDKDYEKNLIEYYAKTKLWLLDQRNPEKGGFPHPQVKTCETCDWNDKGFCKIAKEAVSTVNGCPRPNFEDDLALAAKVVNRTGDEDILNRKILGAEVEFDEIVDGVRLKGVIDLVTEVDEDTLEIIDYKTGRHSKGNAALQKDPQVRIYSVIAKIKWPQYKYRLMTLDYLRKGTISAMFSDEDDELTIQSIKRHNADIRENVNPAPANYEFWLCKFCIGHDRCTQMYASLKKKGKFVLPTIQCSFAHLGSSQCWGGLGCYNSKEVVNDLTVMKYTCQGHKEIPNGGEYQPEPKEEKAAVIEDPPESD